MARDQTIEVMRTHDSLQWPEKCEWTWPIQTHKQIVCLIGTTNHFVHLKQDNPTNSFDEMGKEMQKSIQNDRVSGGSTFAKLLLRRRTGTNCPRPAGENNCIWQVIVIAVQYTPLNNWWGVVSRQTPARALHRQRFRLCLFIYLHAYWRMMIIFTSRGAETKL